MLLVPYAIPEQMDTAVKDNKNLAYRVAARQKARCTLGFISQIIQEISPKPTRALLIRMSVALNGEFINFPLIPAGLIHFLMITAA